MGADQARAARQEPIDVATPSRRPRTVVRRALVVGPADDRHEREADRVADAVVRALATRPGGPDAVGTSAATRIQPRHDGAPIEPDGGAVAGTTSRIARWVGDRTVTGPHGDHATAPPAGPRIRQPGATLSGAAPIRRSPRGVVQRYGEHELDFPPEGTSTYLDSEHRKRLERIKRSLDAKDTQLAWLGLYEEDSTGPVGNLTMRIEWARSHLPMWLAAELMPSAQEWETLEDTAQEALEWLDAHRATPFVAVDAAIARCRTVGIGWLADDLTERRDGIYALVAKGERGDGHQKRANLRTRALDQLARAIDPLCDALASTSTTYDRVTTDLVDSLDSIEVMTNDERLRGRKDFIKIADKLRIRFNALELPLGPPKAPSKPKQGGSQPPTRPSPPDRVEDLTRVLEAAGRQVRVAEQLSKEVTVLGEAVEENYSYLPIRQTPKPEAAPEEVVIPAATKPSVAADMLPIRIANATSVASDIINQPTGGWTTFTVRGRTVYHSSAGSKAAGNQAGTAFWINDGTNRVVVAIGKHTGGDSQTYRIRWRAAGVTGALVKLAPAKPSDHLTG